MPSEGPSAGGTIVRLLGRNFKPVAPEGLDPQPHVVPLRCVFGAQEVIAEVVNDTELVCTAPAVEGLSERDKWLWGQHCHQWGQHKVPGRTFFPNLSKWHYFCSGSISVNPIWPQPRLYMNTGHLVTLSVKTVPALPDPSHTMVSVTPLDSGRQVVFYYRRVVVSFSIAEPLTGPEYGETLVSFRSDYPLLNSKLLKCVFGTIPVDFFIVSTFEATCLSPPREEPGVVELTLTTDGQDLIIYTYMYNLFLPPSLSLSIYIYIYKISTLD